MSWEQAGGSRKLAKVGFQLNKDNLGPYPHGVLMVPKGAEAVAVRPGLTFMATFKAMGNSFVFCLRV